MRVSINDFFIDEFELKNNISKEELNSITPSNYIRKLSRYSSTHLEPSIDWNQIQYHPNFSYKFYDLTYNNLENTKEISVLLEFQNEDANYTNGFFSQSSLFNVPIVWVFPTKILVNCKNFLAKWLHKFGNLSQRDLRKETDINDIKNFYKTKSTGFNFMIDTPFLPRDFSYYDYYLQRNNISLFIGSSGSIKRTFFKKHNFFTRKKLFGNLSIGEPNFLQHLSNKYRQYANQRNTD